MRSCSETDINPNCHWIEYNIYRIKYFLNSFKHFCFFFFAELQEDHSMEHMMRSTDMTFYDRITSFYSAPFTKFMGNLVSFYT